MVTNSMPKWVHRDPSDGLVHVNVGGLKSSLCSSTLKKFPDTRLGKLLSCDSEEDILQVQNYKLKPGSNLVLIRSHSQPRIIVRIKNNL